MQRIIDRTVDIFRRDGVVLYPTDTVWGIGCDATSYKAVERVFNIKQRKRSNSLIILVNSIKMLQEYVTEISYAIIEVIERFEKPVTVIYKNPKDLAKNVIARDNTVAIRIVQDNFCRELIDQFGKPIVSTSANISGMHTPKSFKEIDSSVLAAVDYVVNLHQDKIDASPSSIVKINDNGKIEVIRGSLD